PVGWVESKQGERVLEAVAAPDLWNYSAARMGVGVPAGVYERAHCALKAGELIDLFVTFTEQGPVAELNTQPSERWDQAVSGWLRKIQARQVLARTQLATRAQYDEATSYAATVAGGGLPADTAHTRLANHRLGLQVAPISTTSADIVSGLNRAPGSRDRRTNSPASSKLSVAAWAAISALVAVVVLLTFRTQVSPDPAPEQQPQTSTQAQLPGQSGVATPRVVEPLAPKTVIAKPAQARPARKPTSSRQERKIARSRPEKLRSSKQTARKVAQNTALSPKKPAAPKARQADVAQKVDLLMLSND
ncbi:MAG: hypothetical protein H7Y22_12780, partial [Gemmatimonadaceae bacterium]|nr:hypothetical protein [Gloeobacterales cyanobacterium ES-bin-141]